MHSGLKAPHNTGSPADISIKTWMSTEPTDDCEPLPIHRQTLIKLQRPTVTSSHAQELDHLLFAGLPGHRVDRLRYSELRVM